MKKVVLKGQFLPLLAALTGSFAICFSTASLKAESAQEMSEKTSEKDEDCSKDLLLAYFPEVFVKETFKKFNVPKEKWDTIIKALNNKDKEVIKVVEDKASKMSPNPLKDPQQRQSAVKLFRETLLEIFSKVLKENGITDDKQISSMLDDIQQQKAKRFALCIKKDSELSKTQGNESDDDDEDDDDDDDDEDDDDDDEDDDEDEDVSKDASKDGAKDASKDDNKAIKK